MTSNSLTALAAFILVISFRRLGASSHPPPTSSHSSSYIPPHIEAPAPSPPPPPWERRPPDSPRSPPTTRSSRPHLLFTSSFKTETYLSDRHRDDTNQTVKRIPWKKQPPQPLPSPPHHQRQDETNLNSPRRHQSWI